MYNCIFSAFVAYFSGNNFYEKHIYGSKLAVHVTATTTCWGHSTVECVIHLHVFVWQLCTLDITVIILYSVLLVCLDLCSD